MTKKIRETIGLTFANIFFIILCFLTLVPILYAFSVSINSNNSLLSSNFTFIPRELTMDNYIAVFTEEPILLWLKNSLILAVATLLLSLGTGIPAAYVFSRKTFREEKRFCGF